MRTIAAVGFAGAALFQALSTLAEPIWVSEYQVSDSLAGIVGNNASDAKSDLYTYPTDLTRNISPKRCHSHNDYWRDRPFWSGLSVGCVSTEADVWLVDETLHVGHERSALTDARTFESLYINPILSVLERQNPNSSFLTGPTRNGVFDTDNSQTLYLWVDCKTDGPTTFPYIVRALEPLRAGGWLTSFDGETVTPGPVTVIGTGNTPLDQVAGVSPRDYFFDAPLTNLTGFTPEISPIASTDFQAVFGPLRTGRFSDEQMTILHEQIGNATARGIGARYWDTPSWPVGARNRIWETLWAANVTLINVDDLEAGAGYSNRATFWG